MQEAFSFAAALAAREETDGAEALPSGETEGEGIVTGGRISGQLSKLMPGDVGLEDDAEGEELKAMQRWGSGGGEEEEGVDEEGEVKEEEGGEEGEEEEGEEGEEGEDGFGAWSETASRFEDAVVSVLLPPHMGANLML